MGQTYNAWSIGTALRDPYRMTPEVLSVFDDFKDTDFIGNKKSNGQVTEIRGQELIYRELVRRKLTRCSELTKEEEDEFNDKESKFSVKKVDKFILRAKEQSSAREGFEPDQRARTFTKPFERVGLIQNDGKKKIVTALGKKYIDGDIELADVFLNFGLKWELPNASDKSFNAIKNINIKPFVGTLALISEVNNLWSKENKAVGLDSWETKFFVSTLASYKDIEKTATEIISLRKDYFKLNSKEEKIDFRKRFSDQFISERIFINPERVNIKNANTTLNDYAKDTIPLFKVTGFIENRGYQHIDIPEASSVQASLLIKNELYKPIGFPGYKEYMEYVTDLDAFDAPWKEDLKEKAVIESLDILIDKENRKEKNIDVEEINIELPTQNTNLLSDSADISERKEELKLKKAYGLQNAYLVHENISDLIERYENVMSEKDRSLKLEYYQFLSMLVIDDFEIIKPNFKSNDEFQISFYAPGNIPDMTIEYGTFHIVSEVTVLKNRDQWINEGTPVIVHVDEHKKKYPNIDVIGLFVAPTIHENTLRQWFLEGKMGNNAVIPFTFSQWISILKKYMEARKNGENPKSSNIKNLLFELVPNSNETRHEEWEDRIENQLNEFIII